MNTRHTHRLVIQVIATIMGASTSAFAAVTHSSDTQPVLADVFMLEQIGAKVLAKQDETGVGFARLTTLERERLSVIAHDYKKCGGFEVLPDQEMSAMSPLTVRAFAQLAERTMLDRHFRPSSSMFQTLNQKPEIDQAVNQVSATNLQTNVTYMSTQFNDRLHDGSNRDTAVEAWKARIEEAVRGSNLDVQIDLISHNSTPQKSIRARILGAKRPSEIIVLGAHLDSINQEWFGGGKAPGADDNASGSSNIIEALRIISHQPRTERTLEFFWYAGEEAGLLGSAEIAKDYKDQGKDVVAVVQLDMTLFPGAGKFVLGSMTDFTSAWLRSYLENINGLYVKAQIVDDKCGYGCSDHASWYRQGYPTIMPFEATFNGMNHNLHTSKDVIDENSNFEHSAMFSKIAVALALDLGNSTLREPKN